MKIQSRLSLLTISTSTIAMAAVLLVSAYLIRESVNEGISQKLDVVLEARTTSLVRFLDTIHQEMHILSESPTTVKYLATLSSGYAKLGNNAQTLLQQNYLVDGRTPKDPKPSALLGSDYGQALPAAERFFSRRQDVYKWEDMYLIDPQGNVVFSNLKRQDFATNLVSGPWKDSGLARAVTPLLQAAVPGVMSFADFSYYAPSADHTSAAFVAMPVFDTEKQMFLGVVAIQLPLEQINELMKDKTSLGESGEAFIVGKNGQMLTDSRFREKDSTLPTQLETQGVKKVLDGQSGLEQLLDYRGVDVFEAYKPLNPFRDASALGNPVRWGVIVKMDKAEVYVPFYELTRYLLLTGGVLSLIAAFIGWRSARSISWPLIQTTDALARLAKGELVKIPALEKDSEIGELGKAAEIFRQKAQQIQRENWINENLLALTDAIPTESRIDKAAESLLHQLCERLEVPVGAIYVADEDGYQCVATHGVTRRSQAEDAIKSEAGILEQCARNNQPVVLSPVPKGLTIISTGLAEFSPHELMLFPVSHKDKVLAVLELATVKSLDTFQLEFLDALSRKLGLHLANLQVAERNALLLAETNRLAAELRSNSLYARSLIEASLDPLITIGLDGKIMDVNIATENGLYVNRSG